MGTLEPSAAGQQRTAAYPLNNARADKLGAWPWKAVQRQRCLIPASGFWAPEKLAREKGVAPWSYYSMTDGRPFLMAGLWAEATDPGEGSVIADPVGIPADVVGVQVFGFQTATPPSPHNMLITGDRASTRVLDFERPLQAIPHRVGFAHSA